MSKNLNLQSSTLGLKPKPQAFNPQPQPIVVARKLEHHYPHALKVLILLKPCSNFLASINLQDLKSNIRVGILLTEGRQGRTSIGPYIPAQSNSEITRPRQMKFCTGNPNQHLLQSQRQGFQEAAEVQIERSTGIAEPTPYSQNVSSVLLVTSGFLRVGKQRSQGLTRGESTRASWPPKTGLGFGVWGGLGLGRFRV